MALSSHVDPSVDEPSLDALESRDLQQNIFREMHVEVEGEADQKLNEKVPMEFSAIDKGSSQRVLKTVRPHQTQHHRRLAEEYALNLQAVANFFVV